MCVCICVYNFHNLWQGYWDITGVIVHAARIRQHNISHQASFEFNVNTLWNGFHNPFLLSKALGEIVYMFLQFSQVNQSMRRTIPNLKLIRREMYSMKLTYPNDMCSQCCDTRTALQRVMENTHTKWSIIQKHKSTAAKNEHFLNNFISIAKMVNLMQQPTSFCTVYLLT